MSPQTTAESAFADFAQGWATGNFQPFLDRLTDELTFWYPYGQYRGKFSGQEGKAIHDQAPLMLSASIAAAKPQREEVMPKSHS